MCLKKVSAVDRVVVSDPGFPKVSPIDKGRSIYSICSASPLTREWSRSTVSQAVQLLLWQKGNELRWIEAHHQTKTRYFFKIKILSTISYWPSKTKKTILQKFTIVYIDVWNPIWDLLQLSFPAWIHNLSYRMPVNVYMTRCAKTNYSQRFPVVYSTLVLPKRLYPENSENHQVSRPSLVRPR